LIRIFCIIEGHKGIWVFPHALFYSAHPNSFVLISVLQKIQNEAYITMKRVTDEDLNNQLQSHKKTSSPQYTIGITWFRESNLFHQYRINFYQTYTCISLLLALTMPLATSVTVHVIAQKIRYLACQTTVNWDISEVGSYAFYKINRNSRC
jgi:hypothetical protein